MSYKLRFWVEHWSPERIVQEAFDLISKYKPGLNIAIFPETLNDENVSALACLRESGVEIAFWILLKPDDGYFPNERNMSVFCSHAKEIVSKAVEAGVTPDYVAVDLEMPADQIFGLFNASPVGKLKGVVRLLRENIDPIRFVSARENLSEFVGWVRSRGIKTIAAILPWVALELEGQGNLIQNFMETPVGGINWDVISPMWYSSMFEGSTKGIISQQVANRMAFESSLGLRFRYGDKAGISVGVTGTGILGTEKTFESVGELVESIGAALAAGIRDISVYNLEGVVTRDDPEIWMSEIIAAKPRVPKKNRLLSQSLSALRIFYLAFSRLIRA